MGTGRAWLSRLRSITPSLLLGLVASTLVACKGGASVTVDISVPRPLVEALDVSMGVYFDDNLKGYVHEEELADHGTYSIDIGASQAPVFAQVFDAMFDSVVLMQRDEAAAEAAPATFARTDGDNADVDGIIVPSIEEVQFAIPDQTGGDFYEVWIRYRMQLFGSDGTPLSDWPLIGYGKANQRNYRALEQKESGLNEATIRALRDAAALLSFQFRSQAEIQDWLSSVGGRTP